MKQAYYAAIESDLHFEAYTPGLDPLLPDLARLLAYEFPDDFRGSARDAPERQALLELGTDVMALLRTTPTETQRGNTSFSQVLVLGRGCWHPADLMAGFADPFWKTASDNPVRDINEIDDTRLPWWRDLTSRRQECDDGLFKWVRSSQDHEALLRLILGTHLSLERKDAQIFLAALPSDVFWAVYGAARLLPVEFANRLTFSTYEKKPFHRKARVVGTWRTGGRAIPDVCRADPHFAYDFLSGERPPLLTVGAASSYVDNAVIRWLDKTTRPQIDRFIRDAQGVLSVGELEIWLRATINATSLTDDELRRLSRDDRWTKRLANSPELVIRLLDTWDASDVVAVSRFLAPDLGEETLQRNAEAVVKTIRDDIAGSRAERLKFRFGVVDVLPQRQRKWARDAIAEGPPAVDAGTCRVLLSWLGVPMVGAKVVEMPARIVEEVLDGRHGLTAEIAAAWVLVLDPRLSQTQGVYSRVMRDDEVWDALKRCWRAANLDPTKLPSKLLATVSKDDPTAVKVLEFIVEISEEPRNAKHVEKLLQSMHRTTLFHPAELVNRFRKSILAKGRDWNIELRAGLANDVLSESNAEDAAAILDALLALDARDQMSKKARDQQDALTSMKRWLNGTPGPETTLKQIGEAVRTMTEWPGSTSFSRKSSSASLRREIHKGPQVVDKVISLAASKPDPFEGAEVFKNAFKELKPVWMQYGRDFLDESTERLGVIKNDRDRLRGLLALVWAANADHTLRNPIENFVRSLPPADFNTFTQELRQRQWLVHLALIEPVQGGRFPQRESLLAQIEPAQGERFPQQEGLIGDSGRERQSQSTPRKKNKADEDNDLLIIVIIMLVIVVILIRVFWFAP